MIAHIRMKNFKSWKDSGEVELAPLTGFFGTNSSGKSSLLQMLLLLKQTVGSKEVLFFGDEGLLVNLGNFREVIHGHKEDALLELEFGCKIQSPFTIEFSVRDDGGYPVNHSLDIDSFIFEAAILWREEEFIVQKGCYRFKDGDEEQILEGDHSKKIYGETYWSGSIMSPIIQFSSAFENLFSHVYSLGPTRVHPQRYYHWKTTHPKEIDLWGDKAVAALLSARVRQLTTAHKGKNVPIEERISTWLQKMELAHSFQIVPSGNLDDNNYEIRFQKSPNSAEVTLADMGHGVADLFPLLVHCCYVPEGSTLILEQPGIHLHPKAQADLADLLIEVITERNLQILVESHSEHLLNRLQRRVAEEKISVDKTALYFCRNDEDVSTIDKLKMDEFGNITNWPPNFFGDEMGDLFAMAEAQRERQKRAEG